MKRISSQCTCRDTKRPKQQAVGIYNFKRLRRNNIIKFGGSWWCSADLIKSRFLLLLLRSSGRQTVKLVSFSFPFDYFGNYKIQASLWPRPNLLSWDHGLHIPLLSYPQLCLLGRDLQGSRQMNPLVCFMLCRWRTVCTPRSVSTKPLTFTKPKTCDTY